MAVGFPNFCKLDSNDEWVEAYGYGSLILEKMQPCFHGPPWI